jgi:uncharacterized protein with HEPN domain
MRRDAERLRDIIQCADEIAEFISDKTEESFLTSQLTCAAVAYKLTVIGEASSCVSEALRNRHSQIPWNTAKRLRNIVIHQYHGVDYKIVWMTATTSIPAYRTQIEELLRTEFPGE